MCIYIYIYMYVYIYIYIYIYISTKASWNILYQQPKTRKDSSDKHKQKPPFVETK